MEEVDVLVAGAGPAGLACARAAAMLGARVLVLERSRALGHPVHDSAGSFPDWLPRVGLDPARVVAQPIASMRLATEGVRDVVIRAEAPFACVLERRAVNRELAREAARAGADIRLGSAVTGALRESDAVVGLRGRGRAGDFAIRARIVVDATGAAGVVTRSVGLAPECGIAPGFEHEYANVAGDPEEALFVFGAVAPGGYGWVFPKGRGFANVGVGVTRMKASLASEAEADVAPLRARLPRFLAHEAVAPRMLHAVPVEEHAGVLPVARTMAPTARPGFVAVGDAALAATPHVGEGIRLAALSGDLAGRLAGEALAKGRGGPLLLNEYPEQAHALLPHRGLLWALLERAAALDADGWRRAFALMRGALLVPGGTRFAAAMLRGQIPTTAAAVLPFLGQK